MKKLLLGAIVALLPLTGMTATILGLQAGGGNWAQTPSGTITTSIVTDSLAENEVDEGYFYFSVEHPVPLVPNFKFANTSVSGSSGLIRSLELDQTDTTFYYEILDNVVSLDIGLSARKIDGKATTITDSVTFSGTVPLLYVSAEIALPAGFTLAAEINTISAGSDEISDVTTKITYTTDFMLGIEAGVRTQSLKADLDSEKFDIEFSGIFAGVFFKF